MTAEEAKMLQAEYDAQLCEWLPYGSGLSGKTYAEAIRGIGMGGRMAIGFQPSSKVPPSGLIPRAAVAEALAELLAQAETGARKWFGHHNEANIYQDFIESISATIVKLGLQEERDDYLR